MKAIVYNNYGTFENLRLEHVDKPAPQDNEVLIKVHASSINARDNHLLTADLFIVRLMGMGFFKPKNTILGGDAAGVIEAVGKEVTRFKVGDQVFGDVFGGTAGAYAEYVCVAEDTPLAKKPDHLTFEQAASLPVAAVTALQALRDKGQIKQNDKVLINGASGGVGSFAVQIAKVFNAEVTAVCSTGKIGMVRQLGADYVVDYTKEDFTKNGKRYDIILAVNGYHPLSEYKRSLKPGGRYICIGGKGSQIFEALLYAPFHTMGSDKKMSGLSVRINTADLELISDMVTDFKIRPVIESSYSLEEVPEAFRYFGEGHVKGKLVITVA